MIATEIFVILGYLAPQRIGCGPRSTSLAARSCQLRLVAYGFTVRLIAPRKFKGIETFMHRTALCAARWRTGQPVCSMYRRGPQFYYSSTCSYNDGPLQFYYLFLRW